MTEKHREQAIELLLCAADWAHRTRATPFSTAVEAIRPTLEVEIIASAAWSREYESAQRDLRYGVPLLTGGWYVSMHDTLLEAATKLREEQS